VKRDDEILFAVFGAFLLLSRRGVKPEPQEWGAWGWVWPVPDLAIGAARFPAVVSQELHPGHNGIDICYRATSELLAMLKARFTSENEWDGSVFFAPKGTPVLAAKSGTVYQSNIKSPRGLGIVLDHGKPWATFYQHLASCSVVKGQHVNAGDVIGVMGFDPTDAAQFNHLHFEVWYGGAGDSFVDPEPHMPDWARVTKAV
jgi:murein DD-endopeptidase MepM/ murein hydrolase activator NlpD